MLGLGKNKALYTMDEDDLNDLSTSEKEGHQAFLNFAGQLVTSIAQETSKVEKANFSGHIHSFSPWKQYSDGSTCYERIARYKIRRKIIGPFSKAAAFLEIRQDMRHNNMVTVTVSQPHTTFVPNPRFLPDGYVFVLGDDVRERVGIVQSGPYGLPTPPAAIQRMAGLVKEALNPTS